MSINGALQIGQSAILASQAALQVAGNNMANAATPGYNRQVARLSPSRPEFIGRGGFVGTGVQLARIQRTVDIALQGRARNAIADQNAAEIDQRFLNSIELIRNELISSMQAGKGEEKYLLNLTTTLADNAVIANKQPSVGRQAILITTNYELIDRSSGKVVTKGTTFARVPYDTVRQPFADMQAEKDATERAAREVGADIRTRLAAYFSKQQQSS